MKRMKKLLMRIADKRYLPELMTYIAVWTIVLLAPIISNSLDFLSGRIEQIYWSGIFMIWFDILPFFILFLLNNKILLPLLFLRQKIVTYVISIIVSSIIVLFITGLLSDLQFADRVKFRTEHRMFRYSVDDRGLIDSGRPQSGEYHDLEEPSPPVEGMGKDLKKGGYLDFEKSTGHDKRDMRDKFPIPGERMGRKHLLFPRPPFSDGPFFLFLFRGPFFGRMLIALLMISFNIAVKLFFKSLRNQEAMKELERTQLQSELNYLKYQINPHFFMNTLNNIHALVDLDTEKAKQTIVELSRLMRYVLYESNNRTIMLSKEVQFLQHYVELMRIRYTDKVKIDIVTPGHTDGVQIPPLLFISFVENAFKHGISYQHPSFVSVSMKLEDNKVIFRCSNTNFGNSEDQHHGIGLENIRKRLHLLFGENYTLSINETSERFDVFLSVPV